MKYLKHTYKSLLAVGVFLCFFNSCTDLDEKLYSQLIGDGSYEFTRNDILARFGPVYENLRLTYWGWNGLFDVYEESSDLIITPYRIGVGWGDLYVNMHKHTYNNYTGHFWTVWYYAYNTISYCNQMLEIDIVQESSEFVAELKGVRGLTYYLLLDNFRNVPLDTIFSHEEGFLPEQEDPQKLFSFVEKEMNEVKTALKDQDIVYGKFNYYAACMVLAKMYLNYNAWFGTSDNTYYEKAYEQVNDIITNGSFLLAEEYTEPFRANGSTCPEVIYAIVYDFTYAPGNYLANKCLHGASKATFDLAGTPWNGSCAIPQFIDTYDADDSRLSDTWLYGNQYDSKGNLIHVDGDVFNYSKAVHSIDNPGAYQMEGARFHKYEIVSGNKGTSGDDVPFFRLTDAYMIKAECLLRLGGYNEETEQTAADIVSKVRERAFRFNPAKAIRTVEELKGGSVYNYGHSEYTSEGVTNFDTYVHTVEGGGDIEFGGLLDDLAWEFVGEHHRRQDLIRFKLTSANANVYSGKSWFCKDADFDGNKDVFPIHQDFLDANVNLSQNKGY